MRKWFVDCDIIIDLLAAREPFFKDSALIFQQAQENNIQLYTSPLAIANVYYIVRKSKGDAKTRVILSKLLTLVKLAPIDEACIQQALDSEFKDFEDAIQYFAAKLVHCDYIVTRNIKDYKASAIKAVTPTYLSRFF
jgi:predicted nucleic acid-binding protein